LAQSVTNIRDKKWEKKKTDKDTQQRQSKTKTRQRRQTKQDKDMAETKEDGLRFGYDFEGEGKKDNKKGFVKKTRPTTQQNTQHTYSEQKSTTKGLFVRNSKVIPD
jgi:hypothetical protein